jgi:hypothetical protein
MPRMMDGISGYGRYANANGASSETSRGAGRPSACSKGVKLTRSPLCTVHFGAKQPRGVFRPLLSLTTTRAKKRAGRRYLMLYDPHS